MEIKKYKTRFSLISSGKNSEEKQVFLVATIEGIEVFYYSGYRVSPKNFIKKSKENYIEQIKKNTFNKDGDSSSTINARIRELENASLIVYEQNFKGRDVEFSKDKFKRLLQIQLNELDEKEEPGGMLGLQFFDAYEKYKVESKVSDGRRRHYAADINRLREYGKTKKNPLTFENLNILDYNKYISKGRASNTVVTIMKRLKGFFSYCKMESIIKESPFDRINFASKIGTEIYDEPVCMTREELSKLYNKKMPDSISELVRDMFCLQAAFGCRVGDFVRLTYDNIQDGTLVYFPAKTRGFVNKVVVPISNRANEILNKYKGKGDNGLIMPFVHPNDYNEQLKLVFRIAELKRKVIQFNRDTEKEEVFILHDIASSHLARRTFVDILCQAGEPIHVVASMSGHSENSKAFDRYRRRPEQLQKEAVKRSMD
ncbi:tyrosine-type recombinase/integrase [Dysgonomonas macrotermitis]|uniref:Site-specific recombinase XerD n=1 Tax=Dysgonomonas macrotermitis TaxID=1346286 RepID=A0A1M4SE26_9BACT|nr:tyrosine-type recombinase/integrase [Dysgonomonas macrotermitis]SHE30494.1 Site-specific recombinase XerD [Dysgonomonas macrotermitis]